jgi:hypothetical protein
MKNRWFLALVLTIALNSLPAGSPVVASHTTVFPRQVFILVTKQVDDCSYELFLQWTAESRDFAVAAGGLSSACLPVQVDLGKVLSPSEYDISASLTSGFLKTTIVDEFAGVTAIIRLRVRAANRVDGNESCGARLSGTIFFTELDLLFSFDQDPVACFFYGT